MKKIWLGVLLVVAAAAGWYFYGQQTPPMDVVSAVRLPLLELQRAAERGEPAAQYVLGLRYESGEGGIKEPVLAVSWYRKAAEQGLADAQQALGYDYYKGVGETRDLASALHWFQLAADADEGVDVHIAIATDGVAGSVISGYEHTLAELAAEQGQAESQLLTGLFYLQGKAGKPDPVAAANWLRKAAEQGMRDAQYVLGDLYENGRGVAADRQQAYAWYALAAAGGQPAAKKAQEALMAKMPPASLAQARTLAASYARQYVTAH